MYLLDTNVFAALALPKPVRSVERSFTKHASELVTASVVVHEMWFGIERLPHSERRARLEIPTVIAWRGKRRFEDVVGARHARLHVPDAQDRVPLNVFVRVLGALRKHERVAVGIIVQHRRVVRERNRSIE